MIFSCLSVFEIVIFLKKLYLRKTKLSVYSVSVHHWICSNLGREVHPTLLFTLNNGDHFAQVGISGSFFANF